MGRPRDAGLDEKVMAAARSLLFTAGYARFSVDEVAVVVGAAKTTIYRRWPTKDHLIAAVVIGLLSEPTIPDTGDLRDDLVALVSGIGRGLIAIESAGAPGLLAELVAAAARHAEIGAAVRGQIAARREVATGMLRRAGYEDAELRVDQMVAPLYFRLLVSGAPLPEDFPVSLVDAALRQ